MSDFLDNLIAQNAAAAGDDAGAGTKAGVSTIRPYLPSRFESSASNVPPLDFAAATDFEVDAETTSNAGRASSSDPRRDEQPAPTPRPFERGVEDGAAVPRRTARDGDATRVEARLVPVNEPAPAPRAAEPPMRETLTEHVVFVERERERRAETTAAQSSRSRRSEYEVAPSTLLIVERRSEVYIREEDERRGVAADDERPATQPAPADSARPREDGALTPTRREGRASVNAQPPVARPAAGPDVHVTIGRVEIRAASSPAKQPARRNAPQPMTLEEYQRRRASGEHR